MVDAGPLYLAVVGALLLAALGLGFRVLRGIYREGRDRSRRRRAGEIEKYTEDEEYDRSPAAPSPEPADSGVTCPQCGAANESEFNYCRRCAAPLRRGA
jgi:hypothetical protein